MSQKAVFLILSILLLVAVLLFVSDQVVSLFPWTSLADVHPCRDCDPPVVRVASLWIDSAPVTYLAFDRAMDRQSVADALAVAPAVGLVLRWDEDALRIEPRESLAPGPRYRFTLAETAADADGVPLGQDYHWAYRLDNPVLDVIRPVRNGDHSTPLVIHFSRPMDTDSVEQALRIEPPVAGALHWAGDSTLATFAPASPLPSESEYALRFEGSLRDADGDEFPPVGPFRFTTPPAILSVSPQGEGVHPSAVIEILFDRPMNLQVTEAAVQVVPEMPGRLIWQDTRLILEPDAGLAPSTVYSVTIATGAIGQDGSPILRRPYIWSFRTAEWPVALGVGEEAEGTQCEASADLGSSQDIAVRPLLPGRLMAGDRARLSAIVRNHSVCSRRIYVSMASDLLTIEGPITRTVVLGSGQQRVVSWMAAADRVGEDEIVARAVSGVDGDIVRSPMSVQSMPGGRDQIVPAGSVHIAREYTDVETGLAVVIAQPGQLVRVTLRVEVPDVVSDVVVEDRLPAGLEPLNPEVAATGQGGHHYETRDGSVRFHLQDVSAGEHTLTYLALATHAGTFVAMPAEVYAMDNADIWGHSASGELVVETGSKPVLASPIFGGGGGEGYDALSLCVGGTDVPNDEAYDAMFFEDYGVNPFVDTDEDNLSTFAVDVDTGSYTIMRYYVNDGHLPPDESVRVEEYVNYFDQDYTPPAEGEGAFAVHLEGAPSLYGGEQHHLVRVGLQGYIPSQEQRPDVVLTFVIDVSGSMDRQDRLELVKDALELLVGELRPADQIGIAVYGSRGYSLLPHAPVAEAESILAAINRLLPEGSTNAEEGLTIGYRMASEAFDPEAINRVILCSDGVANVGRTGAGSIWEQISQHAEQGIYLTTVGFGMGNYNDVLMEQLADQGDGFYAYVDTLAEAERLFVYELPSTLQVIARDARVQVEFNPAVVRSYRLIGYENRDIADEDFRNDEVDAGEIGVGHSVTALYEIKLWEGASATDAAMTVYVRYEDPDTGETAEVSRAIAWAAFAPTFEATSARFQLTAVVAEYAEILRSSYWARGSSLEDVLAQAYRVAEHLPEDEDVAEFVDLVERAIEISQQEAHDD